MQTTIKYNNLDPFSSIGNVPIVGREDSAVRLHDKWGVVTTFTLEGMIIGTCDDDFSDLIQKQESLINSFSRDFKSFKIEESGSTLYEAPITIVRSIDFDNAKYVRILPYTITLECYPENLFQGIYGVLEPTRNIQYSEKPDGSIEITRTVSARGFNTSQNNNKNNALENAKKYVDMFKDWDVSYITLPKFLSYNSTVDPCLQSESEIINRFEATYSVSQTYIINPKGRIPNVLLYTLDISYDEKEGIYSTTISGSIQGCKGSTIQDIRATYKLLDLFAITNTEYHKVILNAPNLNIDYLSDEVNETNNAGSIEFSRVYDSDPTPTVAFDYVITKNKKYLDDITTISLQGTIRGRGSLKTRWERVQNYMNGLEIYPLVTGFFPNIVLNPNALSYTIEENSSIGEINISVSYNDREIAPPGFDDYQYTISVTPSLRIYKPTPTLCGVYTVFDIGSNTRSHVSVQGQGRLSIVNPASDSTIRQMIKAIIAPLIGRNTVLKDERIGKSQGSQNVNVTFRREESGENTPFAL